MKWVIVNYVNRASHVGGCRRRRGRCNRCESRIDITNDCKIAKKKGTRRLVNKKEVKTYQVVYDKRIILDKGQNTISFGYYWMPSTTTNQTSAIPKPVPVQTVPDHELYSLVQSQPADQNVDVYPLVLYIVVRF